MQDVINNTVSINQGARTTWPEGTPIQKNSPEEWQTSKLNIQNLRQETALYPESILLTALTGTYDF